MRTEEQDEQPAKRPGISPGHGLIPGRKGLASKGEVRHIRSYKTKAVGGLGRREDNTLRVDPVVKLTIVVCRGQATMLPVMHLSRVTQAALKTTVYPARHWMTVMAVQPCYASNAGSCRYVYQ